MWLIAEYIENTSIGDFMDLIFSKTKESEKLRLTHILEDMFGGKDLPPDSRKLGLSGNLCDLEDDARKERKKETQSRRAQILNTLR